MASVADYGGIGAWLWRAAPIFIAAGMLAVGYITTSLHALFAVAQLFAAISTSPRKALVWTPQS
jgi:hypothetical protein